MFLLFKPTQFSYTPYQLAFYLKHNEILIFIIDFYFYSCNYQKCTYLEKSKEVIIVIMTLEKYFLCCQEILWICDLTKRAMKSAANVEESKGENFCFGCSLANSFACERLLPLDRFFRLSTPVQCVGCWQARGEIKCVF